MSRFLLDGCTALITGASAGIGRELARQLANRAGALVLVARRNDRLEELRAELTARHPSLRVHLHAHDLADLAQIDDLIASLARENLAIDFLINNAGLGDRGPLATSDPGRLRAMTQVNVVALTLLTRALLPPMLAQKRGAILNVSSSASFLPIPGFAVYAASKAYVTSFSEALRGEVRGRGIHVTSLCPGPVHTEFDQIASRSGDAKSPVAPGFIYVPVEKVAHAALRAIERNKPLVIPGLPMKLGMTLARLMPLALLRGAARLSRQEG